MSVKNNQKEWQPIKTAPRDNKPFLAVSPYWMGVLRWFEDDYEDDGGYFVDEHTDRVEIDINEITHWIPLPSPPTESEQSE